MNWDAIGAIGELVGAAAVVATLIYLAAQTRSNTAAVNRAATQAIISGRGEASRFLAGDEEVTELLWRGADDPDSLSKKEWERFLLIVGAVIRPLELGYQDYTDGRMSEDLWAGQRNTLVYWFSRPGFAKWLEVYGHTSQPNFVSYISELVSTQGDA